MIYRNINRIVLALALVAFLASGAVAHAQESATSTEDDTQTIEQLQEQIEALQEQIADLQEQISDQVANQMDEEDDDETATSSDSRNESDFMFLRRQLRQGLSGEDVEALQEWLAQAPDIYPEGLVTGYYGPLTSSAVARLQARLGLPTVGEVGPRTRARIQQILEEGAGNSGNIPPGLQRRFGNDNATSSDDDDSYESDEDEDKDDDDEDNRGRYRSRLRMDLDSLPISVELRERLRSIFGDQDSDDDEDENEEEELEIEAEVENGSTTVEVEYPDGSEEEFVFDVTTLEEVIAALVEETDLTEEEIEAVIEFEAEDEDDDDDDDDSNATST